jgi:hypothetical protein
MDPDGSLDINFLDFCKAAERLGVACDTRRLFGEDSPDTLELHELLPFEGKLVAYFRDWMTKSFGCPADMFMAFESTEANSIGRVTFDEFTEGCKKYRFDAKEKDLKEMFCLLDIRDFGSIAIEDVAFLDKDPKRREGALRKSQMRAQLEQQNVLTGVFKGEQFRGRQAKSHRYAVRAWHAPLYERLPAIVLEKKNLENAKVTRRLKETKELFLSHIEQAFGSRIRAWRKGLDPKGTFAVTKHVLGRFCRNVNLDVHLPTLWKAVAPDGSNYLRIEDVAAKSSAAMAEFRLWAHERFGSCSAMWGALKEVAMPSQDWRSDKVFRSNVFLKALKALDWPGATRAGVGTIICQALDSKGCNLVSEEDMGWLDMWSPPVWLCASPDPNALAALKKVMVEDCAHGKALRAWRTMDVDDTNSVSWSEFRNECARLHFPGNIAGAWRQLDEDITGCISLGQFDRPSCELLTSFKMWLDSTFGSVEYAFRSWDTDGSGSLTLSEMKRGCRRGGWDGDVRTLFECLDLDYSAPGVKSISYQDMQFLDNWVIDQPKEQPAPPKQPGSPGSPKKSASGPADGMNSPSRPARQEQVSNMKNSRVQSCPNLHGKENDGLQLPTVHEEPGAGHVPRTESHAALPPANGYGLPAMAPPALDRNNLMAWHTKRKRIDSGNR